MLGFSNIHMQATLNVDTQTVREKQQTKGKTMNDNDMTLGRWDEVDWNSDPYLPDQMSLCPRCGRHMGLLAKRYREPNQPTSIAYYPVCPNRCEYGKTAGFTGLTVEDEKYGVLRLKPLHTHHADTPKQRISCGQASDVKDAQAAWNQWVEQYGGKVVRLDAHARRENWNIAVECPVCHRECLQTETFGSGAWDDPKRIGCPDHPIVASVSFDRYDYQLLSKLKAQVKVWADWLADHHCNLCDTDALLNVGAMDGYWHCFCDCDFEESRPEGVPLAPVAKFTNLPLTDKGVETPLEGIRNWRERVAARQVIVSANRDRHERNLKQLQTIITELGAAV